MIKGGIKMDNFDTTFKCNYCKHEKTNELFYKTKYGIVCQECYAYINKLEEEDF